MRTIFYNIWQIIMCRNLSKRGKNDHDKLLQPHARRWNRVKHFKRIETRLSFMTYPHIILKSEIMAVDYKQGMLTRDSQFKSPFFCMRAHLPFSTSTMSVSSRLSTSYIASVSIPDDLSSTVLSSIDLRPWFCPWLTCKSCLSRNPPSQLSFW
jgi:hypothetical protein